MEIAISRMPPNTGLALLKLYSMLNTKIEEINDRQEKRARKRFTAATQNLTPVFVRAKPSLLYHIQQMWLTSMINYC
jgi:hypothetical protein